jgi:hypothetical protein
MTIGEDRKKFEAEYKAALEAFEAAQAVITARLLSRTPPTTTEIHREDIARARLLVARRNWTKALG